LFFLDLKRFEKAIMFFIFIIIIFFFEEERLLCLELLHGLRLLNNILTCILC